ncbi:hypothetical protein [uncultured Psychrosphaera sp.]|uniref:hypothetical protein n=1 Tax=uncultured Psychrosphaera sp. TaxID=1403522 RepID=UPI0026080D19|nr:hypothetical protein [uncultured Psychrosphaera sp.]
MTVSAINFNSRNFVKVVGGAKRTTIILGERAYNIGACLLMCDGQPTPELVQIVKVCKTRFGTLGLSDAVEHGYNNISDLKSELESCYQRSIQLTDVITIVRFEMADD